ncbi:hypothetical protein [Solimonas flava]|uniref:hypothetical protein n=1 Tax=Solimonas flava TaxID=415849 RepID=UPI0012B5C991|nr:hypothetical protein [Solimonas flava]
MPPDFGPLSGPAHRRPGMARARRSGPGVRRRRKSATAAWTGSIRSDLPAALPVTREEVSVLLCHARDLIDELLAP